MYFLFLLIDILFFKRWLVRDHTELKTDKDENKYWQSASVNFLFHILVIFVMINAYIPNFVKQIIKLLHVLSVYVLQSFIEYIFRKYVYILLENNFT